MVHTGVEVSTSLSAGRRNTSAPSARYHIAGITERGPVGVAQRVSSPADYASTFGRRTTKSEKTYNEMRLFFAEDGGELYISRVVGPEATRGTVTLEDPAAVPTLQITLNEPGGYAAQTAVKIDAGTGDTFTFSLYQEGLLKLRFANIASPNELLSRTLGHPLITVTNLASTSAAPGNNPAPTPEPEPMTAGTDDFASITTADYIKALNDTGDATRGGAVGVPDLPADIVGPDLIEHAMNFQKVALMCGDLESDETEIKAVAEDLAALEGSDHAGVFWPYLMLPDEGNAGARYVAPTGYVAAARARAHTQTGYWQIPAGERSASRAVTGLSSPTDTRKNNELAESRVSGIIQDAGNIKLYNWWSLSPDQANFRYLSVRDELNNISMDIASELRPFIFSTWDSRGKLLNQIASAVKGVLATLAERDAVSARLNPEDGSVLDPGYTISVDAPTGAFVEENTILVRVEVRTPQTAQLIKAEVVRVPLDAVL